MHLNLVEQAETHIVITLFLGLLLIKLDNKNGPDRFSNSTTQKFKQFRDKTLQNSRNNIIFTFFSSAAGAAAGAAPADPPAGAATATAAPPPVPILLMRSATFFFSHSLAMRLGQYDSTFTLAASNKVTSFSDWHTLIGQKSNQIK